MADRPGAYARALFRLATANFLRFLELEEHGYPEMAVGLVTPRLDIQKIVL